MSFDARTTSLTALQARVLATLLEKSRTVPDSYPLTLNSLLSGCNQKSSREPVMHVTDEDALQALDELRALKLVNEVGGSRVKRWEHHFSGGIGVPSQAAVLLGLLMLRGPQTAAELRLHTERWHRFADISSVEAFLHELQERSDDKGGPLVELLPRAPGAREPRWAHLLCGPVDVAAFAASSKAAAEAPADATVMQRVQALEAKVTALRQTLQQLCEQLGVDNLSHDGQEP